MSCSKSFSPKKKLQATSHLSQNLKLKHIRKSLKVKKRKVLQEEQEAEEELEEVVKDI